MIDFQMRIMMTKTIIKKKKNKDFAIMRILQVLDKVNDSAVTLTGNKKANDMLKM